MNLEWLKIFELKARYLFAVWLFASLLLLSPQSISSKFGFAGIVDSYRGWIGITTVGFFTLWTVQLFSGYREAQKKRKVELAETAKSKADDFQRREKQSKMREEVLRSISTLSKRELFLLAYAVDQNQQTIFASRANRFAHALAAKHLLTPAPTGNIVQYPYTIPNFVWDYLQQHNHELFDSEVFPEYEEWKEIYHGGNDFLRKEIFGDI